MALWTIRSLYRSTVKVSPSRRYYVNSKELRLVKIIPYAGMKSLLFHFEHMGLTQNALHQVFILFSRLENEVSENPFEEDPSYLTFEYDGMYYKFQKPNMSKTPVKVRCSCSDFYFTFAYWDFLRQALYGPKPRPYRRKTTNRKPRNPGKYPGFCKHVANSCIYLEKSGMLS